MEANKVNARKALDGKPYAGNPHVRSGEGGVVPAATPRRGSLLYMLLKMWLGVSGIIVDELAFGDSWYWADIASDDFDGLVTPSIIGKKGFALTDANGVYKTSFKAGADLPIGWANIVNDSRQTLENYKWTWSVLTRVGTYKSEFGDTFQTVDGLSSTVAMIAMQNLGPESSGLGYDGTVKFEAKNMFETENISPLSRTFNFKILDSGVSKEDALDLGDMKNLISITGGGTGAYYWFGQSGFYHADGDAAQSGLCGKGDTSYMSAMWTGGNGNKVPCRIRFKWLLVGDSGDSLTFYAERGPFASERRFLAECPKRQESFFDGNAFAQSADFILGTNGYRRTFKAETVTWEFKRGNSELELHKTHSGFVDEVEIQPLRKVFVYSYGGSLVDFIWVEPGERFDKWMPLPNAPKRSPRNACGEPDAYTFAGWYDDCETVWDDERSGPRSSGSGTRITNSSIVPEGTGTILLHPKWVLVKPNTCYGGGGTGGGTDGGGTGGGTDGGGTGGGDVGCGVNCVDGVSVCVVLLNANGGFVSPDRRIVVAGNPIDYLPDAEWEGHVFDGWFTSAAGGSKVSENTIVNTDTTLYAHWSQEVVKDVSCTVFFNANGGTGTMAAQTFTPGVAQNLSANAFTRPGYTFKGWATSAGGSVVYADGQRITISADLTLFAVYSENIQRFTVTFNANNGSGSMTAQTFQRGEKKALKANAFTRSGYTFDGWATSSRGSVVYADKERIELTADVTLYAHWRQVQAGSPNLVVSSVTVCRQTVYIGETFHLRYTVANKGNAVVPSRFYIDISDGSQRYYSSQSCDSIAAGMEQSYQMNINSSVLGVGTHAITVAADHSGLVAESNESDNSRVIYLYVINPPTTSTTVDWQFHAKSGSPSAAWLSNSTSSKAVATTFKQGEPIYIQINFWNALKKDTTGEVRVAALLDTGNGTQWSWNGLDGGTTAYIVDSARVATSLQNLPVGTYILEILLDNARFHGSTYVWNEASKLNNTMTIEFAVVPDSACTVTFDANGGNVSPQTRTVMSDSTVGALPTPTLNGYAFDGWWTAKSGGAQISPSTKVTSNVTYYAHWVRSVTPTQVPTPAPSPNLGTPGEFDVSFSKAQTVTCMLLDAEDMLAGIVQIKAGKKNKKGVVKISATATLLSGKKVTAKAISMPVGESYEGTLLFRSPLDAMTFEMGAEGGFSLFNDYYTVATAGQIGGTFDVDELSFSMDIDEYPYFGDEWELLLDALPDNVPIMVTGGGKKWTLPRSPAIKYKKSKEDGDVWYELVGLEDETKPNVSGLKLTYTASTGMFKGSFKMYATNEGYISGGKAPALKKYTVNVVGFVVDGVGVGQASCKKPAGGPWTVFVE